MTTTRRQGQEEAGQQQDDAKFVLQKDYLSVYMALALNPDEEQRWPGRRATWAGFAIHGGGGVVVVVVIIIIIISLVLLSCFLTTLLFPRRTIRSICAKYVDSSDDQKKSREASPSPIKGLKQWTDRFAQVLEILNEAEGGSGGSDGSGPRSTAAAAAAAAMDSASVGARASFLRVSSSSLKLF